MKNIFLIGDSICFGAYVCTPQSPGYGVYAKGIFAVSTSVKEEWESKDFSRYNNEIELYNQKAVEVLSPFGEQFNDLYSITKIFDDNLRSDWVHYREEGSKILADAVIDKCFEVIE